MTGGGATVTRGHQAMTSPRGKALITSSCRRARRASAPISASLSPRRRPGSRRTGAATAWRRFRSDGAVRSACPARRSGRGRARPAGPCARPCSPMRDPSAVRPSMSRHNACWTRISLSESSALVASSSSRIGASAGSPGPARLAAAARRQLHATLADHGVESIRQGVGELCHVRRLRRLADLRVGRVRARERDVVAQRPVEHRRSLRHVGDQAAQIHWRSLLMSWPPIRIRPSSMSIIRSRGEPACSCHRPIGQPGRAWSHSAQRDRGR